MESNDKKLRDADLAPGGAAPSEKGVRPNPESGSQDKGGSGSGGELAKVTHKGDGGEEGEAKKKEEALKFVDWVARRVGARPAVMRAVWSAMIQEAPAYLVEENKSINIGFAEIHAFPYRSNWKQVLHAKFPKLIPSLKGVPKELVDAYLFNVGWSSELYNSDLCEFNKESSAIGWNLEVSVNSQWYRVTGKFEEKKRASLGACGYAKRFISLVGKNTKKIFRFFTRYVAQTTIPCAAVRESGRASGQYLVPHVPKGKVRPTAAHGIPAFIVSDSGKKEIKSPEDGALHGENKEVPPVPNIPYSVKDLWEPGNKGG